MRSKHVTIPIALALAIVVCALAAAGDEIADKGRAVLEANKKAVVTVKMVISMSFGGEQAMERESEATGTVVDSTGLAVLSLTATDPASMLGEGEGEANQMTSKVTDVKMLLGDGSEVPAEVVLRDKDLDLAFVRPVQKPAAPWPCVSLDAKAQAQILDEIVVLNQLGKVARRTHSVFVDRIEAIVDKPRKFYVPAQHRGQMIMCSPAFTLDGKFLGIGAIKTIKGEGGGMMGMGGDMLIILVPASDIKESSTQVPPFGEKPKEIGSEPAAPAEKEKPKEGAAPAQGAPAEKPKEGAAPAPKG